MDPNEALRRIRDAIRAAQECQDPQDWADHAIDAIDAFEALDGWIMRGGFLPRDWTESLNPNH